MMKCIYNCTKLYYNEGVNTFESEAERNTYLFLRNQIVHFNIQPSVRDVMRHIGATSPRTASVLINRLIDKGYFVREDASKKLRLLAEEAPTDNDRAVTVNIPLVGNVAAGMPILAEENIDTLIKVDESLLRHKMGVHYALRVRGDSMNQSDIFDGDVVIVHQQDTASQNEIVVALIDEEATIKRLQFDSGKVVLMPNSSNPLNHPIVLRRDFRIQGVVVGRLSGSVV
jgi:repressor LexA